MKYHKYEDHQFIVQAIIDDKYREIYRYQSLFEFIKCNHSSQLSRGELWYPGSYLRGIPPYPNTARGGKYPIVLTDYKNQLISFETLIGITRRDEREQYNARHGRWRKRYHHNPTHRKTHRFRRIRTLQELRYSVSDEHKPYVRRTKRQIPTSWDDLHYIVENNWKSDKRRLHQYRETQ